MSVRFENLRTRKNLDLSDNEEDIGQDDTQVLILSSTNEGGTHEAIVATTTLMGQGQSDTDVEIYSRPHNGEEKVKLIGDPDKKTPASKGIDENGVVHEYEVALQHIGFGLFHIILVLCNGLALTSDAVEVISISFVLPIIFKADEFNLADWELGFLSSIIFVGMLFGSYFWGSLADHIGRKKTLVFSLAVSGVFGFVSAFAPNYVVFLLLRFASGFGVGGSLPVLFPYISEFIRNKYRGPYMGAQSLFWMFGRLLCGAVAWAIIPRTEIDFSMGLFRFHSWRLFIAISAIPSILGVFLYLALPESPRYLLEVGKEKEALKVLNFVHKLNHWRQKDAVYPVKSIQLDVAVSGKKSSIRDKIKSVLARNAEMFSKKLVVRTLLLLIIYFTLSFGSYGVTLWYPTYVNELNIQKDAEKFQMFCAQDTSGLTNSSFPSYCNCQDSNINNSLIADLTLDSWNLENSVLSNVTFRRVLFNRVSFRNVTFESDSVFTDCTFDNSDLTQVYFNGLIFKNINFNNSRICGSEAVNLTVSNLSIQNTTVNSQNTTNMTVPQFVGALNTPNNASECSVAGWVFECPNKVDDFRVYRDSFFISAAALPGNIASMIAVYFLIRKYWLSFSLLASTIMVFLLYVVHDEAVVVLMLCLFTALSTPAWNDASLIIAEVYPTHLRTTSSGIHLVAARIGAIIGNNIFGEFIHVNANIPILIVVAMLIIGAISALPLPKTTRKTLLK